MQYKPLRRAASINKFSIQNCSKEVANRNLIGVQPSGKALDFDSSIRWFKSSHPSHYMGVQLSWESTCPASRGSWVRIPSSPPSFGFHLPKTAKTWIRTQLPPTHRGMWLVAKRYIKLAKQVHFNIAPQLSWLEHLTVMDWCKKHFSNFWSQLNNIFMLIFI